MAFRCQAKLIFGSNAVLRTEIPDQAFSDRLITVAFCYPVPREKQDKNLLEKMICELPGIARKAMAAYRRLLANNLVFPDVKVPEKVKTRLDFDKIVMDFTRKKCEFSPASRISTEEIFHAFSAFCLENRVSCIEKNDFSERMNRLYAEQVTKKKMKFGGTALQGYEGVSLRR